MTQTDPTWDAVMRRNSNKTGTVHLHNAVQPRDHNPEAYLELGQQASRTEFGGSGPPGHRDPCNDSSWMDFIQILVHQHAKTIVHLQDLTAEVEKLKDFRSSFISSISADLGKSSSAGPSDLHHLPQPKDVWTSSPNKLIDSGFSTETKESGNPKEDEDPLYSLLDLIQTKVSTSTSTNSTHNNPSSSTPPTCSCSQVNNGTRQSANKLGSLDLILGFKSGVGENVHIPRDVIRAILRQLDVVELQRQLLFAVANVKTLESQLSSFELEETSSRLASKYLALSHENELLRFKLKEQEIQLEGTKAKLRILEKNISQLEIASPRLSLIPLDSLPRSNNASSANALVSKLFCSHSTTATADVDRLPLQQSRNSNNYYSNIPSDSSAGEKNGTDLPDPGQKSSQQIPGRPSLVTFPSSSSALSASFNLKNESKYTIRSNESSTLLPKSSHPAKEEVVPGTIQEVLCASTSTPDFSLTSPTADDNRNPNHCENKIKPPPPRSGISRIPTKIVNIPPAPPPITHQTHQSISSKSPGSSISSKSSIPIAVTRLKRNGSIRSITGGVGKTTPTLTGKKSTATNFWATWFAT